MLATETSKRRRMIASNEETYPLPITKMPQIATFRLLGIFRCHKMGIGKISTDAFTNVLMTARPTSAETSSIHLRSSDPSQKL